MKQFLIKKIITKQIIPKQKLIKKSGITYLALSILFLVQVNAEDGKNKMSEPADSVALTTSFIQGNKELPQVLYIVPWQEVKKITRKPENMVLHSLYGDIFQPITTAELTSK